MPVALDPGAAEARPLLPASPSPGARALQVIFLVFAFHFATMLVTTWVARAGGWPQSAVPLMGQWIHIALGYLVFFGSGALRRWSLAELRVALPRRCWPQVAAATMLNVAIPFAVLGAGAAWALAFAPGEPPPGYRTNDPALAWEITLHPARMLHLVLLSWCAGPILEELLFRGLLFQAFEKPWGPRAATVLSSLAFGLAHPANMVAAWLGGLVLAGTVLCTGSLRASIVVHALFNLLLSWPLLGQVLFTPRTGDPASPATWAMPLACLVLVTFGIPAFLRNAMRAHPVAAAAE